SSLLGYNLVLRISDLPSKRLYVFNPDTTPTELRQLVGGPAREDLIVANLPDIFRCAATMTAGKIRPSQLLRKLASYPRQNNLPVALLDVSLYSRTPFLTQWIPGTYVTRRVLLGLKRGEAPTATTKANPLAWHGELSAHTPQ
ncbi:Tn3 family transposase, partial [Klebsiella pneumoniae]|uniref:Tn3 family transposase n=1 Tax=Klebsiella pneumoniae TaxID=573 RepID=UPI00265759E2